MILAEGGDFSRFESPNKLLAYAGLSPSTYQSGQLSNCYAHMEKRGSRYLRYAIFNAAKYVCLWDPIFAPCLARKRAEGKRYNVAISHAAAGTNNLCLGEVGTALPLSSVTLLDSHSASCWMPALPYPFLNYLAFRGNRYSRA